MQDLAVIIVSTNEAKWLRPCLSTLFSHMGDVDVDVVVVDNESTDGTSELVQQEFPAARVVRSENRGFSHGNNRGLLTCDARYVLFLNPDTEILHGSFAELVQAMDVRETVGLVGVKQLMADGGLYPTIRRFPNAARVLANAFGAERFRPLRRLGQRELDLQKYDRETSCDWTSGSFMLARREALESAGFLDERFFIYSEEVDLCYRIKEAGWEIRHLPEMTILHHATKGGVSARMEAQAAFAKRQYAAKHFAPGHRAAFLAALGLRYALRSAFGGFDAQSRSQRRRASRRALAVLLGIAPPPFGDPPQQALAPRRTRSRESIAAQPISGRRGARELLARDVEASEAAAPGGAAAELAGRGSEAPVREPR